MRLNRLIRILICGFLMFPLQGMESLNLQSLKKRRVEKPMEVKSELSIIGALPLPQSEDEMSPATRHVIENVESATDKDALLRKLESLSRENAAVQSERILSSILRYQRG